MYTKQQRNEIYHKALQAFTVKTHQGFMCHELSRAINNNAPFIDHEELLKQFPEWANCRPIGFKYIDGTGEGSNIWDDEETSGNQLNNEQFNALRETILCLAIAQL